MRDWTKGLLPASYRGFRFWVEGESGENGGRRVVTHEYVRGEHHDTEEMGRKARGFSVRAYIASDTADADLAAFHEALSSPGPAMLVLPMHGSHLVNCTEVRTSSEKARLGYVSFDLRFILASGQPAPRVAFDLARVASFAAGELAALIPATLGQAFGMATTTVASPLGNMAGFLGGRAKGFADVLAAAGDITLNLLDEVLAIDQLVPPDLDRDPEAGTSADLDIRVVRAAIARAASTEALAAEVARVTEFVHVRLSKADEREAQTAGLTMAINVHGAVPRTSSPAMVQVQRLGGRIVQGVSLLLCAGGAAAAAARGFKSRQEANAARAAIIATYDAVSALAGDVPEVVSAKAQDAVAASIQMIDQTAGDLAPMVRVDLPKALPSTAVAWALYRDPSRAPELVAAAQTGTSLLMPTSFIAPAR